MDAGTRQKRVEGLEAIKGKALQMAAEGKKELAFNLPDEDAFRKAVKAAGKYKKSKK